MAVVKLLDMSCVESKTMSYIMEVSGTGYISKESQKLNQRNCIVRSSVHL